MNRAIINIIKKSIWAVTSVRKNRVVLSSFSGNSYSDNPKAISEKVHEIAPNIDLVWICNGRKLEGAPGYLKQVDKNKSVEYHRALASAKVIVDNFGFNDLPKKKGQRFIQTWHGDRAFKKVLYDSTFVANLNIPESEPGFCDLCIAGSDYGERQYRSAFHYKGKILKVGTPRDDILLHVNDELITQMKKNIGLEENTKYLLYAPTLRRENQNNGQKQNIQGIDITATLSVLEKQYGGMWKCLLRAHPGVTGLQGSGMDGQKIIDVSRHPDMTDLMVVADALITDYSSCAGDFALLRRPLFLFQDDIDEYLKKDRTFYFEMEKSPYLIAHSQDELNKIIVATTFGVAAKNCDDILEFYGTHESGDAAETVAKIIVDYCDE